MHAVLIPDRHVVEAAVLPDRRMPSAHRRGLWVGDGCQVVTTFGYLEAFDAGRRGCGRRHEWQPGGPEPSYDGQGGGGGQRAGEAADRRRPGPTPDGLDRSPSE